MRCSRMRRGTSVSVELEHGKPAQPWRLPGSYQRSHQIMSNRTLLQSAARSGAAYEGQRGDAEGGRRIGLLRVTEEERYGAEVPESDQRLRLVVAGLRPPSRAVLLVLGGCASWITDLGEQVEYGRIPIGKR